MAVRPSPARHERRPRGIAAPSGRDRPNAVALVRLHARRGGAARRRDAHGAAGVPSRARAPSPADRGMAEPRRRPAGRGRHDRRRVAWLDAGVSSRGRAARRQRGRRGHIDDGSGRGGGSGRGRAGRTGGSFNPDRRSRVLGRSARSAPVGGLAAARHRHRRCVVRPRTALRWNAGGRGVRGSRAGRVARDRPSHAVDAGPGEGLVARVAHRVDRRATRPASAAVRRRDPASRARRRSVPHLRCVRAPRGRPDRLRDGSGRRWSRSSMDRRRIRRRPRRRSRPPWPRRPAPGDGGDLRRRVRPGMEHVEGRPVRRGGGNDPRPLAGCRAPGEPARARPGGRFVHGRASSGGLDARRARPRRRHRQRSLAGLRRRGEVDAAARGPRGSAGRQRGVRAYRGRRRARGAERRRGREPGAGHPVRGRSGRRGRSPPGLGAGHRARRTRTRPRQRPVYPAPHRPGGLADLRPCGQWTVRGERAGVHGGGRGRRAPFEPPGLACAAPGRRRARRRPHRHAFAGGLADAIRRRERNHPGGKGHRRRLDVHAPGRASARAERGIVPGRIADRRGPRPDRGRRGSGAGAALARFGGPGRRRPRSAAGVSRPPVGDLVQRRNGSVRSQRDARRPGAPLRPRLAGDHGGVGRGGIERLAARYPFRLGPHPRIDPPRGHGHHRGSGRRGAGGAGRGPHRGHERRCRALPRREPSAGTVRADDRSFRDTRRQRHRPRSGGSPDRKRPVDHRRRQDRP